MECKKKMKQKFKLKKMMMMIEISDALKVKPDPDCKYCHGSGVLPTPPGVNVDPPLTCFCIRKPNASVIRVPSRMNMKKIFSC